MKTILQWIVLVVVSVCCHGDEESMHHLILLDQLPNYISLDSSPQIILRTNFSGFVDFKESDDFKVLLNVTAPSIEEAYAVTADVTESKGRLLIQVYENKLSSSLITLPWIFIIITIATCVVIILASAYALWWYCSKKYLDLQRDYYSHGNVMFRSRNSECLSSGAGELLIQSDHGRDSMIDDGKDLPDLPEEDEDENGIVCSFLLKVQVRNDDSDEDNEKVDDNKLTIKRRYQPPSKRLYREQHMRRHGRRKRHPSLNDPPSYDAVMEYPGGSSDESDGEEAGKKKTYITSVQSMEEKGKRNKPFVESSRSFGEQTSYQSRDLYSYNPLALQTLPVAHSDTELNVRSPRYIAHNIPPRGFVNPMHDDYHANRDRKVEKILNSKESLVQVERSKSPIARDEMKKTAPIPREELVRTPVHVERSASFRSNHSRSSIRQERPKSPNTNEKTKTPTNYEQSITQSQPGQSSTPNHYERGRSPIYVERGKSPSYIYAKAKKPPPIKLPTEVNISEQNNLDDSSGYIELKATTGPPIEKLTPVDQLDAVQGNPMDIPLTSFTGSLKKKRHKSKPESGSLQRTVLEGYNYNNTLPLSPKAELNITGTSTINSQRFSVLSDNSISLYSSGEMFSPTSPYQENLDDDAFDFDVEIPPLKEHDLDGLSEASLPLPSPPPYAKMPPGYSPRTLVPSPKVRPPPLSALSGLSIPVDDDMLSGTYIGLTISPTNTMDQIFQFPSPYRDSGISSEQSLPLSQGDESPFSPAKPVHPAQRKLPPPPPRMYCPPHRFSWDRDGESPEQGDYAKLKSKEENSTKENEELKTTPSSRGFGGVRKKPILKPKQLHLAVICSLSILSLATTVYSAFPSTQTQVHITVYAPKNFLQQDIEVYFNQDRPGDVLDQQYAYVQSYDMVDPYLLKLNSTLCDATQCKHGCDENNGHCVCKKGYRLDSAGVCQDVNECRSVHHRCHENADCMDKEGTYQCHCTGRYYGDGKTCYACDAPCREGTYQDLPCGKNQKKICLSCKKECPKGMSKTDCTKKCTAADYEFKRCTDVEDRECRERRDLRFPSVSSNIIAENMKDVSLVNSEELSRTRGFHIDRGSGFFIKGTVTYFKPQILLQPVDHSVNNELDRFNGSPELVDKYCPYPVPSYYELGKFDLQNITYKNKMYGGKTFIEPCETYMRHGNFPDMQHASRFIYCSQPGPVTNIFELKSGFGSSTPFWIEKEENCVSKNAACLNCTKTCAKKMRLQGGDCGVTDKDNGRSPRLPLCMSCCADSNCTNLCGTYHDYHCQTEQCLVGDLLGFQLRPIYDNANNIYCHMIPVTNQTVMELVYNVINYYETLVSETLIVKSDGSWITTGKMHYGDEIVDIDIDSKVRQIPDFVKMSGVTKQVAAGRYKQGDVSVKTLITQTSAVVRPQSPFSTTSSSFAQHSCEDEVLDNLMMAKGIDEPFDQYPGLVEFFNDNHSYAVSSEGTSDLPSIRIVVDRHKSLLESLFPMAKLVFNHLHGNITHNSTHWVMNVTGKIQECPGVLSINLTDPGYPSEPLYQFVAQVRCPKTFELSFAVPTGDKSYLDKEFALSVKDKDTVHQLFVFKPAGRANVYMSGSTQGQVTTTKDSKQPSHFSIPFMATVIGVVVLLLFIAAFGMMVKFGQPTSDVLEFKWCHLVLMVGYISFHFLFAVCASMTVFVLVIVAVNSDTTAFLKNYQQQRSVKSAFTHLELDHMERHLLAEIHRQNSVANTSKQLCDQQMLIIIENLNDLRKEIERNTTEDIGKKDINNLLSNQMKTLAQKFTTNIDIFRERFESYIKFMRQKFTSELQQTYRSMEQNKWLTTAQFLRRSVKNVRDLENLPTRPFLQWLGIPEDLTQLSLDKPIPVPVLPKFDDVFISGTKGNPNPATNKRSERTHQYHNFWIQPEMLHSNHSQGQNDPYREEETSSYSGYMVFFALMIVIDVVWFLHRMLKAVGVCSLILYGYPIYVDIRDKTDPTQEVDDEAAKRQKRLFKSGFCKTLRDLMLKSLVSMFVPKVIATVFVCLFVYVLSIATFHFVNRETFSYLGYYNNMDDLLKLNEKFINRRLETHASRINLMQYPAYQEIANLYVQRHLYLYRSTENHLKSMHGAHSSFYCDYLKSINVSAVCDNSVTSNLPEVVVSACQFEKISPRHYLRHTTSETNISDLQMDEFLFSIRKLIEDTCYIVLIFMSVIIIKELLGTVIWLYMKRSGFINLRIIFEADEPPNVPHR
ncbi:unnamed protein product [Mytilus coruscus]|uniref:EGF-like domain-containing protein n=1 Tax=Mytilus coruscus TaxID=42192 RepID=A0A6J8DCY3_MYTCO|nr:unnamed protein product [Mytilus coruscus]